MKSIYKFSKENGLPRSSVYAKAKDLGMNTANGLSDDDQQALLQEFGKVPITEAPSAMVLRPPSSICPEIVDPTEMTTVDAPIQQSYDQYMTGVKAATTQRVGQLGHGMSAYAQHAVAQAYADIDMAVATLRANALNSVQVGFQREGE